MKKWVCKQCGLYHKVNPNTIKAGSRVYFYKNKTRSNREPDQINVEAVKGVVLRRNDEFITVLGNAGILKVKATDVYLENAPSNFVYNMFGACKC